MVFRFVYIECICFVALEVILYYGVLELQPCVAVKANFIQSEWRCDGSRLQV